MNTQPDLTNLSDTTSIIQVSSLSVLRSNDVSFLNVFKKIDASHCEIADAGERFFLLMYKAKKKTATLNDLRYDLYVKRSKTQSLQSDLKLQTLPPTSSACMYHSYRAYHTVQVMLGRAHNPIEWGYAADTQDYPYPIPMCLAPAPNHIMQMIACSCKGRCNSNQCSCRRAGLQCTIMCSPCDGQTCSNATIDLDV